MKQYDDFVLALKHTNKGKDFFAANRVYEAGEEFRECLRIVAPHRDNLHVVLANEPRVFLANVNEKLGLTP